MDKEQSERLLLIFLKKCSSSKNGKSTHNF